MPYVTQFLTNTGEWSCPVSYDDCETRHEVLTYLLNTWCTLDRLRGTFAFLAQHGYDFGVTDENAHTLVTVVDDEAGIYVGNATHDAAKAAILDLCGDPDVLSEYLRAVERNMRMTWRARWW